MPVENKSSPLIITFCTSNYLEVLEQWANSIAALDIQNFLVYCLDKESYNYCINENLPCKLLLTDGAYSSILHARCQTFFDLSSRNAAFIHSDVDAIWKKDLRLLIQQEPYADCDLVFSVGTIYPPRIWSKWGFVLCMGVFYARPSKQLAALFEELNSRIENSDQKPMNILINNSRPIWKPNDVKRYQIKHPTKPGKICAYPSTPITAMLQKRQMKIGVFPHYICSRITESERGEYVDHPFTPKVGREKIKAMNRLNLIPGSTPC